MKSTDMKLDLFKNSTFPPAIFEWNLASLKIFKKNLLNFMLSCTNSTFDIHNSYEIKLLTRLC